MTGIFNHGLLRVARQRKGLSQGEAAQRLGVAQPALSRFENAVAAPGEDFVARAALVFDLPASFFYQPDPVFGAPVSVHPMWRKKHDVTGREMDEIIAEINIRTMHIRRLLEAVEFSPQLTIPQFDPEEYGGDIERIAATIRAHWMLPPGPIQNLCAAAERAGCIVVRSSMNDVSVSGVTMSIPGLAPLIILNADMPSDRTRFTLAHEIGHLCMHKFPNPNMEQEANKFASALLMPANEIKIALAGRVDLSRLAALKPEWKVSMAGLLYRGKDLGIIDPRQATFMWKQFSTMRYRLREPAELDFPHEVPGILPRMIKLHLDTFGFSLSDLAKMLHMHESELSQYYDLKVETGRPPDGLRLRVVK